MIATAELSRGRVTSPFSLEEHDIEDCAVSRVLGEACYFKCPDTGNEFEIVVRKRVPDPGLEKVAEETPPPPNTEDEPETMGGEDFSDDFGFSDDESEEEEEDTEDSEDEDDEEETKEESAASTILGLMAEGLSAEAALDLVEMCGMPHDPAMAYGMSYTPMGGGGIMGSGAPMPPMMGGYGDDEEDEGTEEVPLYGDREVDLEDV